MEMAAAEVILAGKTALGKGDEGKERKSR